MHAFTRLSLILVSGTLFLGCANQNSGAGSGDKATNNAPVDTELAAYAGSHPYPTTAPTSEIKVAAIASTDRKMIKLYNFSNQPLSDIDVWVNNGWVQHVRGLTANGSVEIRTDNLYNAFGKNFTSQTEPISHVQIKTTTGFYNVMGPVAQ